jgi:hypothetical protein
LAALSGRQKGAEQPHARGAEKLTNVIHGNLPVNGIEAMENQRTGP